MDACSPAMLAENNKLTELWDNTRLNDDLEGKKYFAQYTEHLAEVNDETCLEKV